MTVEEIKTKLNDLKEQRQQLREEAMDLLEADKVDEAEALMRKVLIRI